MTLDNVAQLETQIDAIDEQLPTLKNFILPGGHPAAAQTHFARAICRRAERYLVALNEQQAVNPYCLQ